MFVYRFICMNYNDFLDRIKSVRKSRHLEQKEVAHAIGKERSVYTRKEKGTTPITVDELFLLASILGLTPEDLLSDTPIHSLSRRLDILLSTTKGTSLHSIVINQIESLINLFEHQAKTVSNLHKKKSA